MLEFADNLDLVACHSTEDGIGGVDGLDEVSSVLPIVAVPLCVDELALLRVHHRIFKVCDVARDFVRPKFLEPQRRVVERSTIGANVIHHEDVLALEVVVASNVDSKNLACLPITLLDSKRHWELKERQKVAIPLASPFVREVKNVDSIGCGLNNLLYVLGYAVEVHPHSVEQCLAHRTVGIGDVNTLESKPVDCVGERLEGEYLVRVLDPVHTCVGDIGKFEPNSAPRLTLEVLYETDDLKQLGVVVVKPCDSVRAIHKCWVVLDELRAIGEHCGVDFHGVLVVQVFYFNHRDFLVSLICL